MTVGVVASRSPASEPSTVHRGAVALRARGFELAWGAHATDEDGRLAESDADRAEGLLGTPERSDVHAVVCLTGGYGAVRTARAPDPARLLALRDLPPKVVADSSHITVLYSGLACEPGWRTFCGPNLT